MIIDLAGRLDEIAAGRAWYGSALAEAIKKPYLSDVEKAVVYRYLNGSQGGMDHVTLQSIAISIRDSEGDR